MDKKGNKKLDKFLMEEYEISETRTESESKTVSEKSEKKSSLKSKSTVSFEPGLEMKPQVGNLKQAGEKSHSKSNDDLMPNSKEEAYRNVLHNAKSLVDMIEFTISLTKFPSPPPPPVLPQVSSSAVNVSSTKSDPFCSCTCHETKKPGLTKDQLQAVSDAWDQSQAPPKSIIYVPKVMEKPRSEMSSEELLKFFNEVKSIQKDEDSPYGGPIILVPKPPNGPIVLIPRPVGSFVAGFTYDDVLNYFGGDDKYEDFPMFLIPRKNESLIVMTSKPLTKGLGITTEKAEMVITDVIVNKTQEGFPAILIPKPLSTAVIIVPRPAPAEPLYFVRRQQTELECQCLIRRLEVAQELNSASLATITEESQSKVFPIKCLAKCGCNCHVKDISPSVEELRGSALEGGACAGGCSIHCPKTNERKLSDTASI